MHRAGGTPSPSHLHLVYIALDVIKLFTLLALAGWAQSYLARRLR